MNGTLPFEVQQTTRFERELKKLVRAHPKAADEYEAILPILATDPSANLEDVYVPPLNLCPAPVGRDCRHAD